MQRFACTVLIALSVVSSFYGGKARPALRVSCTADKRSYAANEAVDLTVTLENVGTSDFYIYRNVEWGWAGIGSILSMRRGT